MKNHTLAIAMNLRAEATAPEWVELVPVGGIVGRDGRKWTLNKPEEVIERSLSMAPGGEIPVDEEHVTEKGGGPSPAVGWIDRMEIRENSIWGRVAWTPRGEELVANREYRHVSPVIAYDGKTREVLAVLSVGLTNRPNLRLTALNREEDEMDWTKLLEALGLSADAGPEDAVGVVGKLKSALAAIAEVLGLSADAGPEEIAAAVKDGRAANRADTPPDLGKFAPRADYDQLKARVERAENRIRRAEIE
ncbi:MAG: hypothetical protein JRI97_13180, partial [Deltaproteobacteria bacterium]|nr:hypothetical protein [Deltaproteobacteria bacterium]